MKSTQSHIPTPCSSYRSSAARMLELPDNDPLKVRWLGHSDNCAACREVIEAHEFVVSRVKTLPDPQVAFVKPAVMSRIKSSGRSKLFKPGEVAWGVSAGLAGIVIGILISGLNHNGYANGSGTESQYQASLILGDDLDDWAVDLAESGDLK